MNGTHWFYGFPLVRFLLYFPFQKFSVKIHNFVPDAFQSTAAEPRPNENEVPKCQFEIMSQNHSLIFLCLPGETLGTK